MPPAEAGHNSQAELLQPGDRVWIRYGQEPVCLWPIPITECGTLDVPYVGAVNVIGLTPADAGFTIRAQLVPQLFHKLDVEIRVAQQNHWSQQPLCASIRP